MLYQESPKIERDIISGGGEGGSKGFWLLYSRYSEFNFWVNL